MSVRLPRLPRVAVMQLWERKKLALDGDVNAYQSFPVRNFSYPGSAGDIPATVDAPSSIADGPVC